MNDETPSFRTLAAKPPPPMRSSGSVIDFQKDGEVLDRYYDALIIHDPLRAVLIVPHRTVGKVDLDQINNAQNLLTWVLALIGKTPADWNEKDWDRVYFIRRLVKRIGEIKGWTWKSRFSPHNSARIILSRESVRTCFSPSQCGDESGNETLW